VKIAALGSVRSEHAHHEGHEVHEGGNEAQGSPLLFVPFVFFVVNDPRFNWQLNPDPVAEERWITTSK
jgi:hypothetical protein